VSLSILQGYTTLMYIYVFSVIVRYPARAAGYNVLNHRLKYLIAP